MREVLGRLMDACAQKQENGCWIWTGRRTVRGYGVIWFGRRFAARAHRIAYVLAHGRLLDQHEVVRHACDNPACVNPAHLVIGTQSDNVQDMIERNRVCRGERRSAANRLARQRHPEAYAVGSRHYRAKLTEALVLEIRRRHAMGEPGSRIAAELGMSRSSINRLISRQSWRHVP